MSGDDYRHMLEYSIWRSRECDEHMLPMLSQLHLSLLLKVIIGWMVLAMIGDNRRRVFRAYSFGYSVDTIAGISQISKDLVERIINTEPDRICRMYELGVTKARLSEMYSVPVDKILEDGNVCGHLCLVKDAVIRRKAYSAYVKGIDTQTIETVLWVQIDDIVKTEPFVIQELYATGVSKGQLAKLYRLTIDELNLEDDTRFDESHGVRTLLSEHKEIPVIARTLHLSEQYVSRLVDRIKLCDRIIRE